MDRIKYCLLLLLIFSACKEQISTTSSSTVENKVHQTSMNDEELNNRTILLNKICAKRQHITECKEWCTKVDCKE